MLTDSRTSMNPKQNKHEENYLKSQHNQLFEINGKQKILKARRKIGMLHIEEYGKRKRTHLLMKTRQTRRQQCLF